MLALYRRHSERCPVHKLKLTPAAKRKHMDCDCPLWIYGNTETTHVPRQSTGTNIIAVAEAQRQTLLKDGQDQEVHGPRLDDCIERFRASRKEELGEKTSAAYRFQLDRLRAYCAMRGVHFMRELSVDFKVEGLPDRMAATSKAQVTAKIRCFLREAYRRSWTEFALAEKVRPYRATHEQKNPYTDAEVDLILAGAEKLKGGRAGYASAPLTSDYFSNSCLRPESGLATQFDSTRRLRTRVNRDCGSTDSRNEKANEQREFNRPRYT